MSNMVVRTNVFALNAHRNMKNVGVEQQRASNRLASGFRINSAADDAAGLAISETMRAQIRGLDQASRNTQDGQSMILTTEGGLEEIGNMLQRVRELMVQASNDTNTQDQRTLIRQEIRQLGTEIISMQNRVEFNTERVLARGPLVDASITTAATLMAGSAHNLNIAGAILTQMENYTLAAINVLSELNINDTYADLAGGAREIVDQATLTVTALQPRFGELITTAGVLGDFVGGTTAGVVATTAHIDQLVTMATAGALAAAGLTATSSIIVSTAGVISIGDRIDTLRLQLQHIQLAQQVLAEDQAGIVREEFRDQHEQIRIFNNEDSTNLNVAFFQVGANASQGISFDFETVSRAVSSAGWTVNILASTMATPGSGSGIGSGVRITPFIQALDASIDDISRVRANLGAVSNRMDYTQRSLDISSENLQDSESRVRNADVAREMMRFTMANVLQQASVSMLAQANQMPNNLLQLLR